MRYSPPVHTCNTNISLQDHSFHDPPLTDLGIEQCSALRDSLKGRYEDVVQVGEVDVIASPMRRTLQTAQLGLGWLLERGVKIEADADWQENSTMPCDTGSPIAQISAAFPDVDFSTVDPVWPEKASSAGAKYAYTRSAVLARGQRGLAKLQSRKEKYVFVVSHSAFLRLAVVGWWFFNGDYRVFDFVDSSDEGGQEGARTEVAQAEGFEKGGLGLSREVRVELGSELPE